MEWLSALARMTRPVRSLARFVGPALLVGLAASSRLGRRARDAAAAGRQLAGDRWRERAAARRARLQARAREPLANLYEVHPDARRALGHDVGLRSVPLDQIRGTAVAGGAQRGGDFLPLPAFRSTNWVGRWQRLRRANDRLAILPPIDLVKYGDDYWVEDGHNRVAAALYNGQQDIDAVVRELRAPGYTADDTTTIATLAPVAAAGSELRAAGAGRFSARAAEEANRLDPGRGEAHDHRHDTGDASGSS
jgi:hypothetical protein